LAVNGNKYKKNISRTGGFFEKQSADVEWGQAVDAQSLRDQTCRDQNVAGSGKNFEGQTTRTQFLNGQTTDEPQRSLGNDPLIVDLEQITADMQGPIRNEANDIGQNMGDALSSEDDQPNFSPPLICLDSSSDDDDYEVDCAESEEEEIVCLAVIPAKK